MGHTQDTALTTMSTEWYDQVWRAEWMDYSRLGPTRRHVRNMIHSLIEPLLFNSVLDVGCGEGSLLRELRERRPHLQMTGTDVSTTALGYARHRVPGGAFFTLDLEFETLPVSADLTVSCEVLVHFHADEAAIAKLAALIRRYLVVVVPQGEMRRFERGDVGRVCNYSRAKLCAKLERAGFAPTTVVEWSFPFFSPLYRDFLDRIPGGTVKGRMELRKRIAAAALYQLFRLNSWRRGDTLVILAAKATSASG